MLTTLRGRGPTSDLSGPADAAARGLCAALGVEELKWSNCVKIIVCPLSKVSQMVSISTPGSESMVGRGPRPTTTALEKWQERNATHVGRD